MTGPATTVVDAEVDGRRLDVRVVDGRIAAVDHGLPRVGTTVVDAGGAALLPGLHDHHRHLLAEAAVGRSVDLAEAPDPAGFDAALRRAAARQPAGWLRAVGYDDRHGPLDARRLDALVPGRAVRVQHRSGAAWVLSTRALVLVDEEADDGWRHRADDALRTRWADDEPPALAPVGRRLAARGVTGVTDCTPYADPRAWRLLADARRRGDLPVRVAVTGSVALATTVPPDGLERGPVKVLVADDALPAPDELATAVAAAHRAGRAVAVHCVTRVGLVLALTAWEAVGAMPGDRVEHASVVPVELIDRLVALGLQVVTQPAFVRARGDRYLVEVDPDDLPHLYRCRSLLAAGIGVGGSTDAPFGPGDPWVAIAAAVDRRTATGRALGPGEALDPRTALARFLTPLDDPGATPRPLAPGAPADLCLLDRPLARALADPAAVGVRATWVAGRVVHVAG